MRWLFCSGLLLFAMATQAMAQDAIGLIKSRTGDAMVERADDTLPIGEGDRVFLNDVMVTGANGSLGITFKDNTRLSLGNNTRLTMDAFVYAPAEDNYSFVARIGRGTVFFTSGVIATVAPEEVVIETPSATIGVRGTRFLIRVGQGE